MSVNFRKIAASVLSLAMMADVTAQPVQTIIAETQPVSAAEEKYDLQEQAIETDATVNDVDYLRGDVDLDGKVTQVDATIILRESLLESTGSNSILEELITEEGKKKFPETYIEMSHRNGDVDQSDGGSKFVQTDATFILRVLLESNISGESFISDSTWNRNIENIKEENDMASMNALVHIKDDNGNVNDIYPATKIENVEGLQTALNSKANSSDVTSGLAGKVDKENGKGLSTNDYTTTEKNKLSGIEAQANKTVVDSALSSSSENPVQNKVVNTALGNKADASITTKVYLNVAAMKADTSLNDGDKCRTLGYYNPNDGGGAYYIINEDSSNNYEETLSSGLYAELIIEDCGNVKQYGAVADGTTDCSNAISAMYSNTGNIVFIKGRYLWNNGITLNSDMSQVIGLDRARIIIGAPIIIAADHCYISNLNFVSKTTNQINCIVFDKGNEDIFDTVIYNCIMQFFNKPIYIKKYASQTRVSTCNFYECSYLLYSEYMGAGYDLFNTVFNDCFVFRTQNKLLDVKLGHTLLQNCYISLSSSNYMYTGYNSVTKFVDCEFEMDPKIEVNENSVVFYCDCTTDFSRCNFLGKASGNLYWFAWADSCQRLSVRDCKFNDSTDAVRMAGLICSPLVHVNSKYGTFEITGTVYNTTDKIRSQKDIGMWASVVPKCNFIDGSGISVNVGQYAIAKLSELTKYTLCDVNNNFIKTIICSDGKLYDSLGNEVDINGDLINQQT